MNRNEKNRITVSAEINAPIENVWTLWTKPEHVTRWNNASPDWHTPTATNDLREGGRFNYRMEARDGSFGFDFGGEYIRVIPRQEITYRLGDGRMVEIRFSKNGNTTSVEETFEVESQNPEEMQRTGWQAILDNFKNYAETGGEKVQLRFETLIDAPAENVYTTMLGDQTYRQWTTPFCANSYYTGSWEKGAGIRFIGEDENGKIGGMVSRIRENIPNRYVSIEHLGMLDGETEITSGPAVDSWAGAQENYSFREEDGKTLLLVEMDANEQSKSYFEETWPKALQQLKTLCEQ